MVFTLGALAVGSFIDKQYNKSIANKNMIEMANAVKAESKSINWKNVGRIVAKVSLVVIGVGLDVAVVGAVAALAATIFFPGAVAAASGAALAAVGIGGAIVIPKVIAGSIIAGITIPYVIGGVVILRKKIVDFARKHVQGKNNDIPEADKRRIGDRFDTATEEERQELLNTLRKYMPVFKKFLEEKKIDLSNDKIANKKILADIDSHLKKLNEFRIPNKNLTKDQTIRIMYDVELLSKFVKAHGFIDLDS